MCKSFCAGMAWMDFCVAAATQIDVYSVVAIRALDMTAWRCFMQIC